MAIINAALLSLIAGLATGLGGVIVSLFGAGGGEASLGQILQQSISPQAVFAFLVVQMLFVPCAATVAAMHQETGSWRWTLAGIVLLLAISLLGGIVTYQITSLFSY